MANLNNYILTFIKISVITTLLFGGLVAQSYATNLIANSITQDDAVLLIEETHININKFVTIVVRK